MRLHGQDVGASPRQDLELGDQPRNDVVADQVGQALFHVQWLAHTAYVARPILDADEQRAARRVGERDEGLQRTSGADRSRLNSSVLPSARLRRSRRSICSEMHYEAVPRAMRLSTIVPSVGAAPSSMHVIAGNTGVAPQVGLEPIRLRGRIREIGPNASLRRTRHSSPSISIPAETSDGGQPSRRVRV